MPDDDEVKVAQVKFGRTTITDDAGVEHHVIVARGEFFGEVKLGFGDNQREAVENLMKMATDSEKVRYSGRAAWFQFPDEHDAVKE